MSLGWLRSRGLGDLACFGLLVTCAVAPLGLEIGKALAEKYNYPRLLDVQQKVDTIFSYTVKSVNTVFGIASSTLQFGPVGGVVAGAAGIASLALPAYIAKKPTAVAVSKIEA